MKRRASTNTHRPTLTPYLGVVEDLEGSSVEPLEEQREGGGHLAVQRGTEVKLEVLHQPPRHIFLVPGTCTLTQHLTPWQGRGRKGRRFSGGEMQSKLAYP